jgi:hypothetical protein
MPQGHNSDINTLKVHGVWQKKTAGKKSRIFLFPSPRAGSKYLPGGDSDVYLPLSHEEIIMPAAPAPKSTIPSPPHTPAVLNSDNR